MAASFRRSPCAGSVFPSNGSVAFRTLRPRTSIRFQRFQYATSPPSSSFSSPKCPHSSRRVSASPIPKIKPSDIFVSQRFGGQNSGSGLRYFTRTAHHGNSYRRFGNGPSRIPQSPQERVQHLLSNRYVWVIIGAGVTIYVWNLETVEATGRRRFNIISVETEVSVGDEAYRSVLNQYRNRILPSNHPQTLMVENVMNRLIPNVKIDKADWKVHVIKDDSMMNAFVLPSGKVFVFTGLMRVTKDEDGLAAVLGHEIGHVIAHHSAERLSSSYLVFAAVVAISSIFDISGQIPNLAMNLLYSLPNSRVQEAEADRIGLTIMSECCFDPKAAVGIWDRFHQLEKNAPPQFLSTHPSV
ncbi:peptidase family M48-domain-containing protein [Talaromyces proteolyticus]|uniref:Peptidase family M48-domain-containing protein n=1 Tax=Talaromyces proteolyticus TaxID=1131652 RepID=A0AAD4L5Z7_9EURO|nr:peptidase family M48-domain-containing protein [Talaromyces proteolyticus]KAH8704187.1 peptidase family M48-domain-containing protein [Talaromyces proteolyticus]